MHESSTVSYTISVLPASQGEYKGWFSTDGQALPLKTSFKIFIVSIALIYDCEEQL